MGARHSPPRATYDEPNRWRRIKFTRIFGPNFPFNSGPLGRNGVERGDLKMSNFEEDSVMVGWPPPWCHAHPHMFGRDMPSAGAAHPIRLTILNFELWFSHHRHSQMGPPEAPPQRLGRPLGPPAAPDPTRLATVPDRWRSRAPPCRRRSCRGVSLHMHCGNQ